VLAVADFFLNTFIHFFSPVSQLLPLIEISRYCCVFGDQLDWLSFQ